tara:strand:+ start:321 stop:506 length:186 start_codon:yes stop_codon:yes gene_type:complete
MATNIAPLLNTIPSTIDLSKTLTPSDYQLAGPLKYATGVRIISGNQAASEGLITELFDPSA